MTEFEVSKGKSEIGDQVMYWIGYIYRYWSFLTGQTSREIIEIAPVEKLVNLYSGYHTLGCWEAIELLNSQEPPV